MRCLDGHHLSKSCSGLKSLSNKQGSKKLTGFNKNIEILEEKKKIDPKINQKLMERVEHRKIEFTPGGFHPEKCAAAEGARQKIEEQRNM